MKYSSIFFLLCHLLVGTAEESVRSQELSDLLAVEKKMKETSSEDLLAAQKYAEEKVAKRLAREQELEIFTKGVRLLVANNDLSAANQLRDDLVGRWHLDVYMTNKKLCILLQEFSNIKNDIIKSELVRSVVREILDRQKLAPVPNQVLAIRFLMTNLETFPAEGLDKLQRETNKLFLQCVSQWASEILPDEKIPKSVSFNLVPAGGNYPAGVSPESIKEPDIRAGYEKMLAEEERKNLIRRAQWQNDHSAKLHFTKIFQYISELNKNNLKVKRDIFDQIEAIAIPEKECKMWLMKTLATAFGYK